MVQKFAAMGLAISLAGASASAQEPHEYFEPADLTPRPLQGCGLYIARPDSPAVVNGVPRVSEYTVRDLGGLWSSLEEPSLYLNSQDPSFGSLSIWRLTYLTDEGWVVLRLEEGRDGAITIRAVRGRVENEMVGRTMTHHRRVEESLERQLRPSEIESLKTVLTPRNAAFLPPLSNCPSLGIHGAYYWLEHARPGLHQLNFAWSPQSGPMLEISGALLKLTGWDLRVSR